MGVSSSKGGTESITLEVVESRVDPWFNVGLRDEAALGRRLLGGGVEPESAIQALRTALATSQQSAAPIRNPKYRGMHFAIPPDDLYVPAAGTVTNRRSLAQKLADWVRGRSERVEAEIERTVSLPIFSLEAPGPPEARSSLSISRASAANPAFELTLFGVGFAGDYTVSMSAEATTSVTGEDAKVIHVPMKIKAQRVGVYEGDSKIDERVTWRAVRRRKGAPMAIRPVSATRRSSVDPSHAYHDFVLSGDQSTEPTVEKMKLTQNGKIELSGQFEAFGAAFGPKAVLTWMDAHDVTVQLPPGRDYRMYELPGKRGMYWNVAGSR